MGVHSIGIRSVKSSDGDGISEDCDHETMLTVDSTIMMSTSSIGLQ